MDSIRVHDKNFVPYLKHEELQEIIKNLALKVYEDAIKKFPSNPQILVGLAEFYLNTKDTTSYNNTVNKALENTQLEPEAKIAMLAPALATSSTAKASSPG